MKTAVKMEIFYFKNQISFLFCPLFLQLSLKTESIYLVQATDAFTEVLTEL